MLRFFRINDPYRLVFIFLILVAVRVCQYAFVPETSLYGLKWLLLGEWLGEGYRLYTQTFDYTGPLAAMIYQWIDMLFGRSPFVHVLLSTLLIILQAGIFNHLLLKNKAYDENGYLPAFLYVVLAVAIPDFMSPSPQLISLTFILLALGHVLRRMDNQVTDALFLNAGFYVGIATLVYLPCAVFFLVFLLSFVLFSTAVTRRLLLYAFGFTLIYGLCALYFYLFGALDAFVDSFLIQGLFMDIRPALPMADFLFICSPFILILLLGLFKTWTAARLNNFQLKVQQVMGLMFIGGVIALLLSNEKMTGLSLFFAIPLICYFWTHYFMLLKRRLIKSIAPLLLIGGLQVFTYFSYQRIGSNSIKEPSLDYPSGVMVLGDALQAYEGIKMNSPCFQQGLCAQAFEGLDYYAQSGELYEIFLRADPSLIVDKLNVMPQLQHRFPQLEAAYKEIAPGLFKKISN